MKDGNVYKLGMLTGCMPKEQADKQTLSQVTNE